MSRFKWTEDLIIPWSQIRAARKMIKAFKPQLLHCFHHCGRYMKIWTGMVQHDCFLTAFVFFFCELYVSVSLYARTAFCINHWYSVLKKKCGRIRPVISQMKVSNSFLAKRCCLNVLFTREDGCFHYIFCLLLSGSQWQTHVSSPAETRSKTFISSS